jgi:hypothetical protein
MIGDVIQRPFIKPSVSRKFRYITVLKPRALVAWPITKSYSIPLVIKPQRKSLIMLKDKYGKKLSETNQLTPWSRIHLKKLTDPQLVKKLSALYAARRFIIAFTRAHQLSLS